MFAVHRYWVTGGLVIGLIAAGCGGSDTQSAPVEASTSEPTAPSSTTEAPPSTATVPPPRPSTSPKAVSIAAATAPYAGFGTDAQAGVFPRTVRHAMGETRIEVPPERVVVLDTGELDTVVELGIKPVGAVDYGADGLPTYFDKEEIAGVEVVGTIQDPNLETIARLRPDLILSSKLRHEKLYDQLARIAPTVFAERVGVTWKQNFDLFAQAVGQEDRAAQTRDRYQQRVTELERSLPNPRPVVSVTRVMADTVRLYQRANFLGVLLTDLGFPRPESQNVDDFAAEVSLERLNEADGDMIILAVFDATKNAYTHQVTASSLWQQLNAVKAGRVHQVDDQTWLGGIGYHAAFAVMDQLGPLLATRGK